MEFKDRIKQLRKENNLTQKELAQKIGVNRSLISQYENGIAKPLVEGQYALCNIFDVSLDYLNGKSNDRTPLSMRDKKDISEKLNAVLIDLQNQQDALMFDGEILDDETRELLVTSLENSLKIAKQIAKMKYNPNKNKGGETLNE